LARVASARGDLEEAFAEVERAIGYAEAVGSLQQVRNAQALRARFWLASGRLASAQGWADSCDLEPYLSPAYERQAEHLTYVRLLIRSGRPDIALWILGAIHERAAAAGRRGDLVEIALLAALAHRADGSLADALRSLDRALELGEPGGYLRVFLNEGGDLAPLLGEAAARGGHRDYARRLLAAVDEAGAMVWPDASGAPDKLSGREVEVLQLVATGLTNHEVGARLFISEKTVKTHLSNILSKLDAANRTHAVERARHLGLL
jgi:LuxR family maltose regulon positive regulatory protein